MTATKTALRAVLLTLALTGCSLIPYDSEYSCPKSEGYGKCMGARENYELSQMGDEDRSRYLSKGAKDVSRFDCAAERKKCGCLDAGENQCSDYDYETMRALKINGCLSAQEIILLDNHNSLLNLQRLVLDRKAVKERTPRERISAEDNNSAGKDADETSEALSGDETTEIDENGNIVIKSGYFDQNLSDKDVKDRVVCGYDQISKSSIVEVMVHRAWLRDKPTPAYPPSSGLEAKRGDRFQTAESNVCGWVRLNNGRYIHQSIVKEIK